VPPQTKRLSNDGTPKVHGLAGYPSTVVQAVSRVTEVRGLRIAPTAIMGSAVRHGTRQGRPPAVASDRFATLDPHRTEPKGGSYRGDAEDCGRGLTPNRQLWLASETNRPRL
jgi:hypothetical protein